MIEEVGGQKKTIKKIKERLNKGDKHQKMYRYVKYDIEFIKIKQKTLLPAKSKNYVIYLQNIT